MMSTFTDLQFWTVVNLQTWGELAIRTLAKIVGEPEFALRFVTIANFFCHTKYGLLTNNIIEVSIYLTKK